MARPVSRSHKIPLNAHLARFIDTLGFMWEGYGFPRGMGRIFGLLLVSTRPLSAEEISDSLRISRSGVSTDTRGLLSIGVIERIRVPGDRTGYYAFSAQAWERAAAMRGQEARRYRDLATQTMRGLPAGHPGRKRLDEFREWAEVFTAAVDWMIAEWTARRRGRARGSLP